MKRLWLGLSVLVALAAWSGWGPSARAQTRGRIDGIVRGPNGPISGLTVNLIRNDTGSTVGSAVTTESGSYTIGGLAVGNYTGQVVSNGAVIATGVGSLTADAVAATVDVTLTENQLRAAAIGAGGGGVNRFLGFGPGGRGLATAVVLTTAGIVGGGYLIYKATQKDSSPTQ